MDGEQPEGEKPIGLAFGWHKLRVDLETPDGGAVDPDTVREFWSSAKIYVTPADGERAEQPLIPAEGSAREFIFSALWEESGDISVLRNGEEEEKWSFSAAMPEPDIRPKDPAAVISTHGDTYRTTAGDFVLRVSFTPENQELMAEGPQDALQTFWQRVGDSVRVDGSASGALTETGEDWTRELTLSVAEKSSYAIGICSRTVTITSSAEMVRSLQVDGQPLAQGTSDEKLMPGEKTVTVTCAPESGEADTEWAEEYWASASIYVETDGGERAKQETDASVPGVRSFSLPTDWGHTYTVTVEREGAAETWTFSTCAQATVTVDTQYMTDVPGQERTLNRAALEEHGLSLSGTAEKGESLTVELWLENEDVTSITRKLQADEEGSWKLELAPSELEVLRDREAVLSVRVRYEDQGTEGLELAKQRICIDTLPPEPARAEFTSESAVLEEGVLKVVGGFGPADELVLEARNDVQVRVNGERLEGADGVFSCSLEGLESAELLVETEDAAGNVQFEQIPVVRYRAPEITAPEMIDAEAWQGIRIAGQGEPGMTVHGDYRVDGGRPISLNEPEYGEDGSWAIPLVLSKQISGEHTLQVDICYDDYPEISSVSMTWDTELIMPVIEQVTVSTGGLEPTAAVSGQTFCFIDNESVRLTVRSSGSRVLLDGAEMEREEQGDSVAVLDRLEDGDTIVIQALDDYGNESDPVELIAKSAAEIVLATAQEELLLGPKHGMTVGGTGQPGWQVHVYCFVNGIVSNAVEMGTVEIGQDGHWQRTFLESDTTLVEDGVDDSAKLELLLRYFPESPSVGPFQFRYDSTIELEVEPVGEGEQVVRGKTEAGAKVQLVTEGDELLGEAEAEEGGTFSLSFSEAARVGESYWLTAADAAGNTKKILLSVVPDENGAQLVIISVSVEGSGAVIHGSARPGYAVEAVDADGTALGQTSAGDTDGAYELRLAALSDGPHRVTVRYAGGLFEADAQTTEFQVDTVKPQITELPGEVSEIAAELRGRVSEAVKLTARTDSGKEVGALETEAGEFALPLEDLYGEKSLTVTAEDAAGNTEDFRVTITRAPRCIGGMDAPAAGAELNWNGTETFRGWLLAAEDFDAEEITLELTDSEGKQISYVLDCAEDSGRLQELGAAAEGRIRLEGASCRMFAQEVDLREFAVGTLTARLLAEGDEPVVLETPEGGSPLTWTLETRTATRNHIILSAALLLALCGTGTALILVTRRIRLLNDAKIDKQSRASNLTIKKRS